MKRTFEVFGVSIDPDEVVGVQKIDDGAFKAVKLTMVDTSAVVIPAAVYTMMKDDIEASLIARMVVERIEYAAEALCAAIELMCCGCDCIG